MTAWQIALTVILCCAAAVALTAAAYFFLLPAYLVRKLRGGKDNISFPPDFAEKEALVKKTADLTYVSRYPSNTYDLYMPASAPKPVPVIVWLHGGFSSRATRAACATWRHAWRQKVLPYARSITPWLPNTNILPQLSSLMNL